MQNKKDLCLQTPMMCEQKYQPMTTAEGGVTPLMHIQLRNVLMWSTLLMTNWDEYTSLHLP